MLFKGPASTSFSDKHTPQALQVKAGKQASQDSNQASQTASNHHPLRIDPWCFDCSTAHHAPKRTTAAAAATTTTTTLRLCIRCCVFGSWQPETEKCATWRKRSPRAYLGLRGGCSLDEASALLAHRPEDGHERVQVERDHEEEDRQRLVGGEVEGTGYIARGKRWAARSLERRRGGDMTNQRKDGSF